MGRSIVGLISGIAVGGLIVGLIRAIAFNMYPVPENLSQEELKIFLAEMQNGFYFFIIGSHILGTFATGIIASVISKNHKTSWGLAGVLVILIITAYSNYHNLYPDWVKLLDITLTAIAGYLGARIPTWN